MADLPPPVRALLQEHISSPTQLEILLLLHSAGGLLMVEEIYAQVRTSPHAAATHLSDLVGSGMVERVFDGPPAGYRFHYDDARSETVARLALLDPQSRARIVSAIFPGQA
jgi:predicted ArsR family transcriptional regulator